jgi:hypothetical protein
MIGQVEDTTSHSKNISFLEQQKRDAAELIVDIDNEIALLQVADVDKARIRNKFFRLMYHMYALDVVQFVSHKPEDVTPLNCTECNNNNNPPLHQLFWTEVVG